VTAEATITLKLPLELYGRLQHLAAQVQTDPVTLIERLVAQEHHHRDTLPDPVVALVGAYARAQALIDSIAPSEDPNLYLAAEAVGPQVDGLHAWEIAPTRYRRGPAGEAMRFFETIS
jgi:hypothetical protein